MRNELINGKPGPAAAKPVYVFQEFPKTKYHPAAGEAIVHNKEGEERLGDGWYDSPAHFPEVNDAKPTPDPDAPAQSGLDAVLEENHRLTEDNTRLAAELDQAQEKERSDRDEIARLETANAALQKENGKLKKAAEKKEKADEKEKTDSK